MIPKRTLGRTGFEVSALGLGTTEIGFVYGIGPRDVPSKKDAIYLLEKAVDLGITFIDTAAYYEQAEECIGASGVGRRGSVLIATKCGHFLDRGEKLSEQELTKLFREEVEGSLRKLKMDVLPLVQVHGGSAEQISSGILSSAMNTFKKEGKLQHFGISTRGEEAPLAAIKDGNFDTLQLAHSILDQRMVARVFAEAVKNNIGIINRSVLLKGALTPARVHLAPGLAPLKENADKADQIAKDLGMSLPDLAVRFALSNPAISSVLVGSNKIPHLESAAKAVEAGPLSADILEKLRALAMEDRDQVDPKFWDKHFIADAK